MMRLRPERVLAVDVRPTARRESIALASGAVSRGLPGFPSVLECCLLQPGRLGLRLPAMPCNGIADWPEKVHLQSHSGLSQYGFKGARAVLDGIRELGG